MKITALVENKSSRGLKTAHGLSLYIETKKHKILFDLGPDDTLFENSRALGIDLQSVDTVIISHGHMDHGGALEQFLDVNKTAKVYAQRKAFEKYYSKVLFKKVSIGLNSALQTHPQLVLLDGDITLDDELSLFTVQDTGKYRSNANDTLYSGAGRDDFAHEQHLMLMGEPTVLIMGCGHTGVVNVLEKAARHGPAVCVGGYHLWNPTTKITVPQELLGGIASELAKYKIKYYTCHCTGQAAYNYLSERLPNMGYLSCGDTLEIPG